MKEYYFYVDNTPDALLHAVPLQYPRRAAYPYDDLVSTNRSRSKTEFEYELVDTGVFDEDRYFDVEVEYAKAEPEDILMAVTVHNRGPTLLRSRSSDCLVSQHRRGMASPSGPPSSPTNLGGSSPNITSWATRSLPHRSEATWLFTENGVNAERLFGGNNLTPIRGTAYTTSCRRQERRRQPRGIGTKATAHHAAREQCRPASRRRVTSGFSAVGIGFDNRESRSEFRPRLELRRQEADEFLQCPHPAPGISADSAAVMRQALAGMLWSKQFYHFDVDLWLQEHEPIATPAPTRDCRNMQWVPHVERRHYFNARQVGVPVVRRRGTWPFTACH